LYDVEYHGAAFRFKYHPEYGVDGKMKRPKGKRNQLIFNGMKLTRSVINARATIDYSIARERMTRTSQVMSIWWSCAGLDRF